MMELKTFRARSMAECLAEVKKSLGRDAVILHTRSYRVGAVLGIGGSDIIEITASADPRAAGPMIRQAPRTAPRSSAAGVISPSSGVPARFQPVTWTEHPAEHSTEPKPDSPRSRASVAPAEPLPRTPATPVSHRASQLATRAPLSPVDAGARASIEEELASIKRMVGQVLQVSRSTSAIRSTLGPADPLFPLHARLTETQLSPDLVDELIGLVREEMAGSAPEDEDAQRLSLLRHLEKRIPVVASPWAEPSSSPGPRLIALVGPTGVGKTTTIAKLAAAYRLRRSRRVGLITCDTYRIAAVDQLRTYANIIGLPLKVAATPAEAKSALESLGGCEIVLLDTAGRSHNDAPRLAELEAVVRSLRPAETHLVLSATSAEPVLQAAADRFAFLQPDRLILSKLDEAAEVGVLANLSRRTNLPLSFVTTGQEVPDQIEAAEAGRLAKRILAGIGEPELAFVAEAV